MSEANMSIGEAWRSHTEEAPRSECHLPETQTDTPCADRIKKLGLRDFVVTRSCTVALPEFNTFMVPWTPSHQSVDPFTHICPHFLSIDSGQTP